MLFNQTAADRKVRVFSLSPDFLERFQDKQPNWGPVGYFTYKRTYARLVDPDDPNSRTEEFWETLKRVVEGCYNIQKIHCRQYSLPWQEQKAQKSAQDMFERMWDFKFLPPGRGLWMMGTDVVYDRGAASLQNCFAGDTEIITKDGIIPIGTVVGTIQTVLTTDGSWVEAPIRSFGKQRLSRIRLRKVWDDIEKDIYCTKDHRWFTTRHIFSFGDHLTLEGVPAIETTTAKMGGGARLLSVYPDTGIGDPEWRVMDISSSDREEEVYCATVEGYGAFALEGNILTGNCAFVSSESISEDFADPFCFLMDMSMLGVGTGSDTKGTGRVKIQNPRTNKEPYIVEDSREGWVELIRVILNSFVGKGHFPLSINYTKVRGRGVPLKTFGGKASGPKPLQDMVENLTHLLLPAGVNATFEVPYDHDTGKISVAKVSFQGSGDPYRIPSSHIVDIFNYIGKGVVAGGIRRTAEIMFGEPDDEEFLKLKQDKEALEDRRWASNNSVYAYQGMDYGPIADRIAENGEPGIVWMDNARTFSRMNGVPDNKDWRVKGMNPCSEQPLESYELCNLVESFPAHHDTYEDYERTLKMAYLYAKTVTLVPTHIPRANAVMTRNRRIGCSMSGIQQAMVKLGRRSFLEWCDNGYGYIQKLDRIYSDWLGVPLSIKTTTVKPSGTTSLLCGATPGIHFPHSPFYIRHIRVADTSPLVEACREAGYQVEPDPYADNTFVVAFPVKEKHFVKGKSEATIWEQFLNAADMQRYWANNAVSVTVTFNQNEVQDIRSCLESFEDRLKGVSLLPLSDGDHGYKFAPYVSITEKEYDQMISRISPINMSNSKHEVDDKFCSGDKCEIPLKR